MEFNEKEMEMVFEYLNIIKFGLFIIFTTLFFYYLRKNKHIRTKWGYYFLFLILSASFTYSQFFTLTEMSDVTKTQNIMMGQSKTISNGRSILKYLEESRPTVRGVTKEETEKELLNQQAKSKCLAKQIETKQDEYK